MSEELIKQEFIRQTVEKDIRDIFNAQLLIASRRIYSQGSNRRQHQGNGQVVKGRSGALMDALQNPKFSMLSSGNGIIATSNLPLYIRFLDMKEHGNYQIYNRQVWGILYNNTMQTVRYGYSSQIRQRIRVELQNAFPE